MWLEYDDDTDQPLPSYLILLFWYTHEKVEGWKGHIVRFLESLDLVLGLNHPGFQISKIWDTVVVSRYFETLSCINILICHWQWLKSTSNIELKFLLLVQSTLVDLFLVRLLGIWNFSGLIAFTTFYILTLYLPPILFSGILMSSHFCLGCLFQGW